MDIGSIPVPRRINGLKSLRFILLNSHGAPMRSPRIAPYIDEFAPCYCSFTILEVMMTSMSILYFLPGRGSSLNGRLGLELQSRGYELQGRVLEGDFAKLSFAEQVDHVASDLRELDGRGIPVIANSWGAYWALHALLHNQKSHSEMLLISPILGAVRGEGRMFKSPLSRVMERSIDEGLFPEMDLTILVGTDDWQSPHDRSRTLCNSTDSRLVVAEGKGHDLGRAVVIEVLDAWL